MALNHGPPNSFRHTEVFDMESASYNQAARTAFEQALGIKCLPPETIERLRSAGFLPVRGLTVRVVASDVRYRIEPNPEDPGRWLGRYDTNNGLVTYWGPGGDCFVAVVTDETVSLAAELAKHKRGANVPLSNMERLGTTATLHRLADPYWIPYEIQKELETAAAAEAAAND